MGEPHCHRLHITDAQLLGKFFERNNRQDVVEHFHPFELSRSKAVQLASNPGEDRYYIGKILHEVFGFGMLRGWNEGYTVPSFGILIGEGYQGQGLGRLLTTSILDDCALCATSVRLTVSKSNHRATKLYQSLGFRVESELVASSGEKQYLMTKLFGTENG